VAKEQDDGGYGQERTRYERWVDRVQEPSDRAATLAAGPAIENEDHDGDNEGQYEVLGAESPRAPITTAKSVQPLSTASPTAESTAIAPGRPSTDAFD
jgi:hypothetical protein